MTNLKRALALLKVSILLVTSLNIAYADLPVWSYDAGPSTKLGSMGRKLIDITARIPNMPQLSYDIIGKQKFRPAFGPIPWRMRQGKNQVKILFIGQDGTHIAEAAGRPATAGFGGRAQDLAAYFGVNEGAAFINTYAFTIKGQYGAYESPYLFSKNGKDVFRSSNIVPNSLWQITHGQNSPITKWRNDLMDWIISNNKESLKLIVTFGGAARDAVAAFVESKGGKVGARIKEADMKYIQVPEMMEVYAGGNNTFPVPLNKKGKDLYQEILGRKLNYKAKMNERASKDQLAAKASLKENTALYKKKMVFTKGGPFENGILNPAQIGGYDLNKMKIKGKLTRSLKGLKLNDGSKIKLDLLAVELPHPSYLSRLSKAEASSSVAKKLAALKPHVAAGWEIEADPEQTNTFALGEPYNYSRSNIGPEYYDFGTPANRMVPVSSASRMRGNANVIILGTRDRPKFDMAQIEKMTNSPQTQLLEESELFIARPRSIEARYTFDPGPGSYFAKLMKKNIDFKKIFKTKPGKTWKKNKISAFYTMSHPDAGDFGHYRGTFKDPKVVILADPASYDDIATARALTGKRGQYLQGLLNDLGYEDQVLIIKTVPVGMDGASDADWKTVLKATAKYRKDLLTNIFRKTSPELVLTDGPFAKAEMAKVFKGTDETPVINIERTDSAKSGLEDAAEELAELYDNFSPALKMADIPRSHLSFYARSWEGTGGTHVITATGKFKGFAFAIIAPKWAWTQKTGLSLISDSDVENMIEELEIEGLPLPGETIPEYLSRMNIREESIPEAG